MKVCTIWALARLAYSLNNPKFVDMSKKKQGLVSGNINYTGSWPPGPKPVLSTGQSIVGTPNDICGFVQWVNSQTNVSNEIKMIYNNLVETQPQQIAACNNRSNSNNVKIIFDDRVTSNYNGNSSLASSTAANCSNNALLGIGINSAFFNTLANGSQCSGASNKPVSRINTPINTSTATTSCSTAASLSLPSLVGNVAGNTSVSTLPLLSSIAIPDIETMPKPVIQTVVVTSSTTISQTLTVTTTVSSMAAMPNIPQQVIVASQPQEPCPDVISPKIIYPSQVVKRGKTRRRKAIREPDEKTEDVQKELIGILKALIAQQDEANSMKNIIMAGQSDDEPKTVTVTKPKSTSALTITVTQPAPASPSTPPPQMVTAPVVNGPTATASLASKTDDNSAQQAKTVTITKTVDHVASSTPKASEETPGTISASTSQPVGAGKQSIQSLLESLSDIISLQKRQVIQPVPIDKMPKAASIQSLTPANNPPKPRRSSSTQRSSSSTASKKLRGTSTMDDVISEIIAQPADGSNNPDTARPSGPSKKNGRGKTRSDDHSALLTASEPEDDIGESVNERPLWSGVLGFLHGKDKKKQIANFQEAGAKKDVPKLFGSKGNKDADAGQDSTKKLIDQLTDFINKDEKTQQDIIIMLQAIQAAKRNLGTNASQTTISISPISPVSTTDTNSKSVAVSSESVLNVSKADVKSAEPEKTWKTVTIVLENENIINGYKRMIDEKEKEIQKLKNEKGGDNNSINRTIDGNNKTISSDSEAASTSADQQNSAHRNVITSTSYKIIYNTPSTIPFNKTSTTSGSAASPFSSINSVIMGMFGQGSSSAPAKSTIVVTLTKTVSESDLAKNSTTVTTTASQTLSQNSQAKESVSAPSITIMDSVPSSSTKTRSTSTPTAPAVTTKNIQVLSLQAGSSRSSSAQQSLRPTITTTVLSKGSERKLQSAQLKLQDMRGGHPKIIEVNLPIGEIQKAFEQDRSQAS